MPAFLDYGIKTAEFGDPTLNLEDKDGVMRELMSFYNQFNADYWRNFRFTNGVVKGIINL